MKNAHQWANQLSHTALGITIGDIRRIQSDALLWAANLSGPLHRLEVLQRAQLLERLAEGSHDQADHDDEQKI